ncbi:hypothetical protein [Pollutibacter soli]|uniref:phosphotriesterase family protein n=1 Tax=Pollutibacter soli TaxID=3034157 RepID=UPI0030137BC9
MHRRQFILQGSMAALATGLDLSAVALNSQGRIFTVNGPIEPSQMGMTLVHEHVMVDFAGANVSTGKAYNPDEVFDIALPYLNEIKNAGCKTFIDCTPSLLGRDVRILQRLSNATGLNIITNTGFYGAASEKFLPDSIKKMTAKEVAAAWIKESQSGIDGTNIRPGFMKLGLDGLPFTESIEKIINAAAFTYKATGLTIGIHTGKGGEPALKELEILEKNGVPPKKWIWIHAQNETDLTYHIQLAKRGAWISFDGISSKNVDEYITRLKKMKSENLLHRVLVSQDAGWYNVGQEKGGKFRNYMDFFTHFLPALRKDGFTDLDIKTLTERNPAEAFRVS